MHAVGTYLQKFLSASSHQWNMGEILGVIMKKNGLTILGMKVIKSLRLGKNLYHSQQKPLVVFFLRMVYP